jgi:hypothetical protein
MVFLLGCWFGMATEKVEKFFERVFDKYPSIRLKLHKKVMLTLVKIAIPQHCKLNTSEERFT